jgi:phosphoribosylformylglycinamidine cyclo-ligase
LCAAIDRRTWRVPTVFRSLAEAGDVDPEEMYRVFNMGIGMVAAVRPGDRERGLRALKEAGIRAWDIGRVEEGSEGLRWAG